MIGADAKYKEILEGIGWFLKDTSFVSLNLTDEQFAIVQRANAQGGGETPEESLCKILELGLESLKGRELVKP